MSKDTCTEEKRNNKGCAGVRRGTVPWRTFVRLYMENSA